jgi:hypothetical protein
MFELFARIPLRPPVLRPSTLGSSPSIRLLTFFLLVSAFGAAAPARAGGLFTLTKDSEITRSTLSGLEGRTWPAKVGEADICLWKNDKLAVYSITIDTMFKPAYGWWKEQCTKYNTTLPITVLCVVNLVGKLGVWGTWPDWQEYVSQGFEVGSHSMTHGSGITQDAAGNWVGPEGWGGPEWEYSESRKQIEANIPGYRVRSIFPPGGKGTEAFRNHPSAANHYLCNRNGGRMLNRPGNINYQSINFTSAVSMAGSLGNGKANMDAENLFKPGQEYFRGWAVLMLHWGEQNPKSEEFPSTVKMLEFFQGTHAADVWPGLFGDVAQYGQERDTATLKMDVASPDRISGTLTCLMDPEHYQYPLTLKVRIDNAWKQVSASQNNAGIPATVITHEGNNYALVEVVPNRGPFTLSQ